MFSSATFARGARENNQKSSTRVFSVVDLSKTSQLSPTHFHLYPLSTRKLYSALKCFVYFCHVLPIIIFLWESSEMKAIINSPEMASGGGVYITFKVSWSILRYFPFPIFPFSVFPIFKYPEYMPGADWAISPFL